jgi:deazaflavin-dependent oxidoreductase (nitroreductase family)
MDDLGEQLAGWGKVIRLQTRGRASGRAVEVAVGYVEEADGSVLVAAGSPDADWARNLDAEPRCRIVVGDVAWTSARAELLDGPEAQRAVRELILKYGTPAERLGRGPAYRISREEATPD